MQVKMKDFKPTKDYNRCEIVGFAKLDGSIELTPGCCSLYGAKVKYKNYYIASVRYYEDTQSISLIFSKEPVDMEEAINATPKEKEQAKEIAKNIAFMELFKQKLKENKNDK